MKTGSDRRDTRRGTEKKVIFGLLALAAVFCIIFGGITLFEKYEQERHPAGDVKSVRWIDDNTVYLDGELYGFDHRIETYLFVGTDANGSPEVGAEDYHGALADYLMLLVMDHTADTYGCIAIDRNTITRIDMLNAEGRVAKWRDMQINTAHWYGRNPAENAENTERAVQYLLGELEYIDGYFVLNMENIGLFNNAAGGVTVTIEDEMEHVDPAFRMGATVTLTDEQAEKFVRARMSVGEGDNASRMRRQKAYMDSFFKKIGENMKKNPEYAQKFWSTMRDAAVTDMTGNDASRIGEKIRSGESKGILNIEGEHTHGYVLGDGVRHEEFYPDTESILAVMSDLFSLVHIPDEDESEEDWEDESEEDWEDESEDVFEDWDDGSEDWDDGSWDWEDESEDILVEFDDGSWDWEDETE